MRSREPQGGVDRMSGTWRAAADAEARQTNRFGPEIVKQDNEPIVTAFRDRLKTVAGVGFVPAPLPRRNSRNAIVNHLFLRIA
jgi:hypothetical protein